MAHRLARALDLRPGEGRTLIVLAGHMFLATATTTILSASKNGLFLSVYPGRLIPAAVIAAALVTAAVAVVFAGVISGTARRSLAVGLTAVVALTLVASRTAFLLNERSSFALYLVLSAAQVLIVTHAWDYVGDLLTGRQAKRIMPLVGIGASVGALLGGASVAPMALSLGTANLLLVAGGLVAVATPLLWLVPEPARHEDEGLGMDAGAMRSFLRGAGRGFRSLASEPLLRVVAAGAILLTLTGTLIELQFKFALQANFDQDRITAVYGLMSSAVGVGTLLVQVAASRVIFPKFGVSFATVLHAGVLAFASGGITLFGGFLVLAALQATDDVLQNSLQKPIEQVSLLPFPGGVKSAAVATLGGVLRPLSQAAAGAMALALVGRSLLPWAAAAAFLGFLVLLKHRSLYLRALEHALAKHTVDFGPISPTSLVVDRGALAVIDRGLGDGDATVVVFALSLLEQISAADALPRAVRLLDHPTAEVRGQAALILGRLDLVDEHGYRDAVRKRLQVEEDPFVLAALLSTTGRWSDVADVNLPRFLGHADRRVRREALVALARADRPDAMERLDAMLSSDDADSRWAAASAVGALGLGNRVGALSRLVEDAHTRPAALDALVTLGPAAVPALARMLGDRALPLSLRRSVITALAGVDSARAHRALVELLEEPALGPAALTSLLRLRRAGRIEPVPSSALRPMLEAEIRKGLRYSLAASAIREDGSDDRALFVSHELEELRTRAVHRVLRMLSLTYDPPRLVAVEAGLTSEDAAARSHALELLEGVLSSEDGRLVMPFAEATAEGFAVDRVAPLLADVSRLLSEPLETLVDEPDWWPRALALHALRRDREVSVPGRSKESFIEPGPGREEEQTMIPLIEKVMILKGSQLFRSFPGNELAGIASVAEVVYLETGDAVFRQGDDGDAFYMVVQGAVRITRDSHELAVLGPREGFGEMAILDQETRSASATAAETTTLLKVDRDSFDRLIEQNPAVARGIYRVLNRRLRNTLAQLAKG